LKNFFQGFLIKNFFEVLADEQAILYGRLGQHKEALSIYTNKLVDFAAAERHCLIYYNENDLNNSQVIFNYRKNYKIFYRFFTIYFVLMLLVAMKLTEKNRKKMEKNKL